MKGQAFLSTAAAVVVTAGPAAAQEPTAPPAPAPSTAPAPSSGALSIGLERVGGQAAAVLAGDRFRVRVTPYVAGQRVVVRVYRAGRKVAAKALTVQPGGANGAFLAGLRLSRPGRVVVRASHRATAEQASMVAPGRGLDVLPRRVQPGARGDGVRMLQRRLRRPGDADRPGLLSDLPA